MAGAKLVSDALRSACVLVVDDEPANVALLTRLLRSAGIERIHAVTDSREAASRYREVDADLVLLDLHMPYANGFVVLQELQQALAADAFLPVIVLTADTTTESRDRALQAGAKDFLTKPFDHTEVLLRVRNLLETAVLYADVQRRNAELYADLRRREQAEQQRNEENKRRAARIESVLADGAHSVVYQQVADLRSGVVVGVEALSRFHLEPIRSPDKWFEEAAQVGRGLELEVAAAEVALEVLPDLPADAFVSINTSPSTAARPELAVLLRQHPADRIVLELTEHTPVDDYRELLDALGPLRSEGLRVAVDDAGAGYSGLRHVLRLRPDIIKLDTALTRGIDADPARRALATALVAFAEEIGATIIAEGVESWAEVETLRGLGVASAQGYRLARPGALPASAARLDVHAATH